MLTQILTQTPTFVWPLLAYLLFIGFKARKTGVVPLFILAIMPAVFLTWSFYSVLIRYGSLTMMVLWAASVLLGAFVGFMLTQRLPLRFDKERKRVELPGSWLTLIFSMSIFSCRYFLGMMYSLRPELIGSLPLLAIELLATAISGIFLGRLLGCLQKYKVSPHSNLC